MGGTKIYDPLKYIYNSNKNYKKIYYLEIYFYSLMEK